MEDSHLAKLTGLSGQVVKRTRLGLTKEGWFLRIKDTYKGEPKLTYLVGKDAVKSTSRAVLKVKQSKKVAAQRAKLAEHFGCKDWDELVQVKSMDEISNAMDKVIYS